MEFTNNDQIKVEFKDGSEIIAKINIVDGDKIQASALNKNEKYNEGDTIYLDKSQDKITKMNISKKGKITKRTDGYHVLSESGKNLGGPYKTKAEAEKRLKQVEYFKHKKAKRFQWAFDKHKPQYKYNPDTNVIEKDEENVTKVGMKKEAYHKQDTNVWLTKTWDDWKGDNICRKILESDLSDDEKKQKLMERITQVFNDNTIYGALFSDTNKELEKEDIHHYDETNQPLQIDEAEIDKAIEEYNEEKEAWNEDNEMFETRSNKRTMADRDNDITIQTEGDNYFTPTNVMEGDVISYMDGDSYGDGKILKIEGDEVIIESLIDKGVTKRIPLDSISTSPKDQDLMDEKGFFDFDDIDVDELEDNEPWIDPAGGHHEGRTPNLKQYEMKKQSHELSGETRKEVDNTFNDIKRLISEYDQTDDYNKLLEIKGILTSLLRVVEAEAKECMDSKSKEARGKRAFHYTEEDFNNRDFRMFEDYKYMDGEVTFQSGTEEYEKLNSMDESLWENFLNRMAGYGVTVSYDNVEDEFVFQGY